jgi:IclR family KDG regulon transcriptional repressor
MASQSVKSVERAMDVMDAIRAAGGSMGVTELSQELGLAKSTVHRLLVALTKKEMLRQDERTEQYIFGHKILEMASSVSQHPDVISVAMPYLEELRDRTGETAALALKVGRQYCYVVQAVSPKEYRVNPVLGRNYPMHWAATGKAILSAMPMDELEECMKVVPELRSTERTVTDVGVLREQLAQLCQDGYAASFGERNIGSVAVSSPIRNRRGYAYAAACIVGPESRIRREDVPSLGRTVAEVTRKIEVACQALGIES